MSISTVLLRASVAAGVVSTALLIWLWRQSEQAARPAAPAPVASAVPAAAPAAPTPPAANTESSTLSLLAALERAIARADARANEAVLSFKDDEAMRRFLERAQKAGLTILGQSDRLRAVRVRFDAFRALGEELLANAGDYSAIAANNLVNIPSAPAKEQRAAVDQVPFGNSTLAFLGAANVDRSTWGLGTTIAILDTGVAADTTFGPGRVSTLDVGLGRSPGHGSEDGHGTAVAALAAGTAADAPGVAAGANLLSIRVTDANGTSDMFTIAQAIIAAVEAGAKIINVSLGGYSTAAVLDAAIGYATQQGAVIVAAAGNDQAAQLAWPAADPRVVSVGAIDRAEQQVFFSNSGAQLQLTAPGYGVQTAWLDGQRVTVDGTSASAPIVAGAIAAVMSRNPGTTPQQAAELLARTANDAGQPGADAAFGRGIVNLGTAMNTNNPSYVDTAVASHYFDSEADQMQFVVQNRSGRTMSGLTLDVAVGNSTSTYTVPVLAAGASYVAKVNVSPTALAATGSLVFTTQLTNPAGVTDQVPANNRRSSVLSAPPKP